MSCLENCMYDKVLVILRKRVSAENDVIDSTDLKGQHYFEEDLYFGYSEKLI